MMENTGKNLRLKRLYKHNPERMFIVPLDHSVTDGPFAANVEYDKTLQQIAEGGADAVILHKGRLRNLSEDFYKKISVIVHVSASTRYASDVNEKYIVANVEDAVRRGADGISAHVNLGSDTEQQQLRDLAALSDSCEKFGIPLLAMMYARGEHIGNHPESQILAHAAALAADLGADIVKLSLPRNADQINWITSHSPIPVLAAGGSKLNEADFMHYVKQVIDGGATGLAAGRNIFMSGDVTGMVRRTRRQLDQDDSLFGIKKLRNDERAMFSSDERLPS